jgi:NAD(P)-dependent dehydrogenase (short-subunit alcohol dehydrogenase family)
MSKTTFPPQQQKQQPGRERPMHPQPEELRQSYKGSGKLEGKAALITGGDSGIGRAVALLYAREGADIAIVYLNEHDDAADTRRFVEKEGRRCIVIAGDVQDPRFCEQAVEKTVAQLGKLDVLVNNAGYLHYQDSVENLSDEELERTFRTNIYSQFYMSRAALKHLKEGSAIVNTASVTAYRGSRRALDYSASKGAIVSFTRSLALTLVEKKIRVNAVAPGPTWTPLIPSGYPATQVEMFGANTSMRRAAQPSEIAPSYVFLASDDASYMTGQVLHPDGGEIANG